MNIENFEFIGDKIKKIRKSKGLTQAQLAELVGIHEKQVSKIETGKSYPTRKNLAKILNVLNADFLDPINGEIKNETNLDKISLLKIINSASDKEIKIYNAILKELKKTLKD